MNGSAAPTGGNVGDYYLDTATSTLYGPKTASGWPGTGLSLVGAAGPQGPPGPTGATGATGATGPQGPAGSGILTLFGFMHIQNVNANEVCFGAPTSVSGNVVCDGPTGPAPENVILLASPYSTESLSVSLGSAIGSPVTVTLEWGPLNQGTPLDYSASYSEANLQPVATCTIPTGSLTCQSGSVSSSIPAGSILTVSTSAIAVLSPSYGDAAVLTTVTLQ